MKIASIAFTENGAKIVKMLVREMDVKGYVFEKYKTDGLETFNNVSSLVRDISRNIMRLCLSARAELRCVR